MSAGIKTVVIEDGTEVPIEREPLPLPLPTSKDLTALKRHLSTNPNVNLNETAIETAVGLFINLPKVIRIATHEAGNDGLSSQYVGSTHLLILEGEADAEALSYLLGSVRLSGLPKGPQITGVRDEAGRLQAQLSVEFDSVAEAESLVDSTVRGTLLDTGAIYSESILGHGVMSPVEAVLVESRFRDGTPSMVNAALYDGTLRATSAAWVRYYDSTLSPARNIERVAQELRDALTTPARKRRARYLRQAEAANLAYARSGLTMPVLREFQARRIPVRLIVGAQFSDETDLDELPAAIAAAQSIRHISVSPWREAAKDTVTAQRTVLHLHQADHVSEAFVHLTEDRPLSDEEINLLFPGADPAMVTDRTGHARPLWRALIIVRTLTNPQVYDEAKRFIRSDQGIATVRPHRYAGFIGVLVDLPWRLTKPQTTDTARNAWRNGGVLSEGIFADWEPVFEPIEELLRLAQDGDVSAQRTLQVLAGTALLADGILTRDRGSKIGEDGVAYRATPPVLLASWIDTRHGRLQAAQVVRSFNHERAGGSGTSRAVGVDYTYPVVDDEGVPVPSGQSYRMLIEGDLFEQASPQKAAGRHEQVSAAQRNRSLSREQLNEQRRFMIVDLIGRAATIVQQLEAELADYPSKLPEHPFGTRADWKLIRSKVGDLGESMILLMPPPDPESPLLEPEENDMQDADGLEEA
ncbi:hypothetical protein AB0K18_12340 [Nonomuraea sp. NPDC049421]|uniref:hypothetical protein n=1 Tax=Nonomuraea sp. NPDC049421 TaxID=3155275 RepID=UPI00341B5670